MQSATIQSAERDYCVPKRRKEFDTIIVARLPQCSSAINLRVNQELRVRRSGRRHRKVLISIVGNNKLGRPASWRDQRPV
jgi:hypothetical protein